LALLIGAIPFAAGIREVKGRRGRPAASFGPTAARAARLGAGDSDPRMMTAGGVLSGFAAVSAN
jgi:hypothetical protein